MDKNASTKDAPSTSDAMGIPTSASVLTLPSAPEDGFQTRIGASIVEEFVAGHTAADVLRELVQNEFDADGDNMSVVFGRSDLSILGSGRPIDRKGWARLDVVIGTGRVAGDAEHAIIEAKQNGIGSKNFGLRSLFLFGNRIYVRSAGRMAVLDLPKLGTQLVPDPAMRAQRGVQIHVPYRDAAFEKLAPFTEERETDAFDKMARGLLVTLLKLALTGPKTGIRRLTLRSDRIGQTLYWSQTVKPVHCKATGIKALRRVGRLTDQRVADAANPIKTTFEEIEFTRAVPIPSQFNGQSIPGYYRAGKHAVRVSVSLPIRRRRIDSSATGRFYYPLQAPGTVTGSALSVSAPFELVTDRSALLLSDWNRWLAEQAADVAVTLLRKDWNQRFGHDAYLIACSNGPAEPDAFAKEFHERLRTTECWPTASKARFAKAVDVVVPERRELNGFLSAHQYLASGLSEIDAVATLVRACGGKPFTRNSLVRLRCAGSDGSQLETKISHEANFYYTDYDRQLSDPERQIAMGRALGVFARHLSPQNRQDLRVTPSTLAADGKLRPAKELVVVSEDLWDICPAPAAARLHRALINEPALVLLCEPFDLNAWIKAAAQRAAAGTIETEEREALYEYLLSADAELSRSALAAVRRSPVMRNQRNEWIAPDVMVILPVEQERLLNNAIHTPAAKLVTNKKLIACLRLRRKLEGGDLVAFAARLVEEPEKADAFESLLRVHSKLLSRTDVAALEQVAFLRARSGILVAPTNLHVDNPINRICAGHNDRIVAGRNKALYKHLGCRERPSVSTMLQVLSAVRDKNLPPPRPEIFYPMLVLALRAEKKPLSELVTQPVLNVGTHYHAPQGVLVGPHVPSCFALTIPYVKGPAAIVEAFQSLGASSHPHERHWVHLFSCCHDRYGAQQPVPGPVRKLLQDAYQLRNHGGLPPDVEDRIRCLLGRDHKLYSRLDVLEGRLVEDDFPALSAALARADASIQFADVSEGSRRFFQALGLKRLTSIASTPHVSVGEECHRPAWFQSRHAEKIMTLVRREDFSRALDLLAYAHARESKAFHAISSDEISRSLSAIERIAFVTTIDRIYTVEGNSLTIATDAAALPDRIVLKPMRTKFEFQQSLAYALAELIGAVELADVRRISVAILPLLMCETSADMFAYLERQGLKPNEWIELDMPVVDLPAEAEAPPLPEMEGLRKLVDQMFARDQPTHSADLSGEELVTVDSPTISETPTQRSPRPVFELPPLDAVQTTIVYPSEQAVAVRSASSWNSSGRSRDVGWTPPDWHTIERDRMVGDRGEEIVYRAELERVRQLGFAEPEKRVVWVSKIDAGIDHDIRSIDKDGEPIWIEVKSTMGTDGRFDWPQREFQKALREGERYTLWRVYEAHTEHPTAKPFRNPASLFARAVLHLEISKLRGFVEPKCA
jgi:hypothetical protein